MNHGSTARLANGATVNLILIFLAFQPVFIIPAYSHSFGKVDQAKY